MGSKNSKDETSVSSICSVYLSSPRRSFVILLPYLVSSTAVAVLLDLENQCPLQSVGTEVFNACDIVSATVEINSNLSTVAMGVDSIHQRQ